MRCVEIVSLGNVARSTTSTRWPLRASSIAVGDPAHRAPTTIASYVFGMELLLGRIERLPLKVGGGERADFRGTTQLPPSGGDG